MGYSLFWLAIKGKSQELICQELGLQNSHISEDLLESDISGTALLTNWYLIVANRNHGNLLHADLLRSLSVSCEVIACAVEEHVMYSAAEYWRNSRKIWPVIHDAQLGIDICTLKANCRQVLTALVNSYALSKNQRSYNTT